MMLAIGFSYKALIMLRYVPSIPRFFRAFIMNACWIVLKAFCVSIDVMMWFLSLILFVLYYIYWFVNVVPSLSLWNETYSIMVYELFNMLDFVSKYFIKDFQIYIYQGYWPVTFCFDESLCGFGIRVKLVLQYVFGSIHSFCTLWNNEEHQCLFLF
jgi:hypothetical protein